MKTRIPIGWYAGWKSTVIGIIKACYAAELEGKTMDKDWLTGKK